MFKHLLLIALSIFLLSACGGGSGTGSSDTGSISFNVDWDRQSAESVKSAIRASSDVCSDYGIETVNAYVLNSSSSSVASGSWACSAHSGTISSVPVGSGYTVQLEGLDSGGTVTWSGSVTGISVTANTTASAGTITMTYIGSDSTPPYIVSFDPLQDATDVPVTTTITATFNVGMAPSTINTDTFTLFDYGTNSYISGAVSYDSSTMIATFTPSANLSYGTMYMANMQAGSNGVLDYKGWGIIGTTWVQFTTEAAPTSAPSAPTDVSATAGDSEVEITWTGSTGATSYNIYYSTTTGVTKTNGTKITGATSPYTHTGLTNGTTYYYVVTAVNSYGESGESSEVSGTPQATVQILVVAGGGGGGSNTPLHSSGGGGAGGYMYDPAVPVSVQSYTITVGSGGPAGSPGGQNGQNGGDSSFDSLITAIGGGGGGGANDGGTQSGVAGGSGGGGGATIFYHGGAGLGTSGQGNNGGEGYNAYNGAGGGGGAGGIGANGSASGSGSGGDGLSNSISGLSVTYAGGGGGGSASGGSGGGGNGGYNNNGLNGTANSGGGGGGAYSDNGGSYTGGSGGSGIVIIRYTTGLINATGGTITYSGGDTIHTFTTSGTFTVN